MGATFWFCPELSVLERIMAAMGDVTGPPQGEWLDAWAPPEPRALPDLREALVAQMRSPYEHVGLTRMLQMGKGTLSPRTGDPARDARILLDEEHQRLHDAVLYFVTADMTRLARAAAETLPVTTFHPEDVPSSSGFVMFAEPIGGYTPTRDGDPDVVGAWGSDAVLRPEVKIVAVSWGDSRIMQPDSGVWVTFWSDTDFAAEARSLRQQQRVSPAQAERMVRAQRAELTWDNEILMQYEPDKIRVLRNGRPEPLRVEAIAPDGPGWTQLQDSTMAWGHVLRATWLLMTQPGVTDVEQVALSRTRRRRIERAGLDTAPVRVIRIRHRENVPVRAGEPGHYQVRWTVRGHWRRQWYPSRQEHRQVWINPHIKGPDDAPLRTNRNVHVLDSSDQQR